jgi:TRAP-type C4-dicarboxylate transport system permease small subunit
MRRGAWAWDASNHVLLGVFGKLLTRRGAWAWDASNRVLLCVFGKLLMRRGAWAWFHGVWTCGAKVLEY